MVAASESFRERVTRHREALGGRRCPVMAAGDAEQTPPTGQAAAWLEEVTPRHPRSAHEVAWQLARLCGEDSQVTIPWRSLADAVGTMDKLGRHVAYAQRGAEILCETGWLEITTTGSKRGAKTTFHLVPGPRSQLCT